MKFKLTKDYPEHLKGTILTKIGDKYWTDDNKLWVSEDSVESEKNLDFKEVIEVKKGDLLYRPEIDGTVTEVIAEKSGEVGDEFFLQKDKAEKVSLEISKLINK